MRKWCLSFIFLFKKLLSKLKFELLYYFFKLCIFLIFTGMCTMHMHTCKLQLHQFLVSRISFSLQLSIITNDTCKTKIHTCTLQLHQFLVSRISFHLQLGFITIETILITNDRCSNLHIWLSGKTSLPRYINF